MAKDTEKLIRQLSLISFLMAERRPVSALEIKQDVEGYSQMNDEAFARRFYADRAELESLGINLQVDKPAEGYYEAETYTLPPENFYLPAIKFSDQELAALRTALTLLDGRFAYAEPMRLALQQLSFGKPSPLGSPEGVAMTMTASPGGRELSQRLSKIETAIFRRKTIVFDYYTIGRDSEETRKVDPYHLLFRDGHFYLIGHSHERGALRVFRLDRIRGKVGYSSKAEHDFPSPPADEFDAREYATRTEWQLGAAKGTARVWISDKIDWLTRRNYGQAGTIVPAEDADDAPGPGIVLETEYADSRRLVSWVLRTGAHARILGPDDLVEEAEERAQLVLDRHAEPFEPAQPVERRLEALDEEGPEERETPIRPERFARLVTLAGLLIDAAREGDKLELREVCAELQISEQELRQDIDVLNVVNFGGGSYVLYAEVRGDVVEIDPEPYGDNFARPARLLPLEGKALVAAIDLVGEHLPAGSLASARQKVVDALGHDPANDGLQISQARGDDSEIARVASQAIHDRRVLEIDYYKENEDEFSARRVEPYQLVNGLEGWYVYAYDPSKDGFRHFRLDRIKSANIADEQFELRDDREPGTGDWLETGEVENARRARVWVSPEQARWVREGKRVVEEHEDGAVIVELTFSSDDFLVREILDGAGDLVVLEPEDGRKAVAGAAGELLRGAPQPA